MFNFALHFCLPVVASSILLQNVDMHSEKKDEVIAEVLSIQKSLVVPLEATEMPDFAQTGFITIQMSPEYLHRFLESGEMIVAYDDEQIIGYLLLEDIEGYLEWAYKQTIDSEWNLAELMDSKYIDQIGVLSSYAKQGIGTALINEAKRKSPYGLLTDILIEPYSNPASIAFFNKRGFSNIGFITVEANVIRPKHTIAMMLWHPLKNVSCN